MKNNILKITSKALMSLMVD